MAIFGRSYPIGAAIKIIRPKASIYTKIAFVNSNTIAGQLNVASGITQILPVSRQFGNTLIAWFHLPTVTGRTLSVSGTGWTLGDQNDSGGSCAAWAWCVVNGSEASPTWTWTGGVATWHGQIHQWSGADEVTPIGNTNKASGSVSPVSVAAVTTTDDLGIVVALCHTTGNNAIPTDAAWTSDANYNDVTASHRTLEKAVAASGSASPALSLSISAGRWHSFGIELDGGGSGPNFVRLTQNYVESIHTGDPASQLVRSTQQYSETIHTGDPASQLVRSTRQYTEAVHSGDPADQKVRLTRQYIEVVHGFNVTVEPSLFDDTDVFYTPTVEQAGFLLAPELFDDTDTFYSPTVTTGIILSATTLFDDTDSFYSPTITGALTLSPSLFVDTDTIYSPLVTFPQFLVPDLFDDTDTFYTPEVLRSTYTVQPSLFSDTDAFYSPTITTGISQLVVHGIPADDVFYSHTLTTSYTLQPDLFVDTDVFHSGSSSQFLPAVILVVGTTSLFDDTDTFFTPTISTGPVSVLPSHFVDQDLLYTPFVSPQTGQGQGGGSHSGNVPENYKYATRFTIGQSGLVVALQVQSNSPQSINTRMAIYAHLTSGGGKPGALLAQSAVKTSVVTGANIYPLLVPVSVLVNQVVWVALQADGVFQWFLNLGGTSKFNKDTFSDGITDPFGNVSNENKTAPVFAIIMQSATAAIQPDPVPHDDVFYSPTVIVSDWVSAPLFDDTDFIYAATVSIGNQLLPSAFPADDVIFSPVVTASNLVSFSHYEDEDVFYTPGVGQSSGSDHDVFSPAMPHDDVFYSPIVTPQFAVVAPSLVPDDDQIFTPEVTYRNDAAAGHYTDDDVFYEPTVTLSGSMGAGHFNDQDQFYEATLTVIGGTRTLEPPLVVDEDVFYSPRVGDLPDVLTVNLSGDSTGRTALRGTKVRRTGIDGSNQED